MTIGPDRVQVAKTESTALGGDDGDIGVHGGPVPIQPQEDAIESAGIYLQDASNRDETTYVAREGNNLTFRDKSRDQIHTLSQTLAFPLDHLDGLAIQRNATNPTYSLDIGAGTCRSDDGTENIVNAATLTVDITVTGVNGLDTGSETVDAQYYVWLIYNHTTKTTASLLSLSSTSPTLPSGYTKQRRIGSWYNDSLGDFRVASQVVGVGRQRVYFYDGMSRVEVAVLAGGNATSWSTVDLSDFVPPVANQVLLGVYLDGRNIDSYVHIRPYGSSIASPIYVQLAGCSILFQRSSASSLIPVFLNGIQSIEYQVSEYQSSASIVVDGYTELL